MLEQGPTNFSGYQYWERNDIVSDFTSPGGMRIEMDVKIISSTYGPGGAPKTWRAGFQYLFTDGAGRAASVGISDTGVRIAAGASLQNALSSPFIPLDTTSSFRKYRLSATATGVALHVDGILISTLALGLTLLLYLLPVRI